MSHAVSPTTGAARELRVRVTIGFEVGGLEWFTPGRSMKVGRCRFEVHPPEGRLGLGQHAGLFAHWRDKENAERMNHWIEVLLRCARLVREAAAA